MPTLTNNDDTYTGSNANETILALMGWDTVHGAGGNDSIVGAQGDDRLYGDSGDDTLEGDEGDDILVGELGNDLIDGGAGLDWVDYSGAAGPVNVSLWDTSPQNTGQGVDTLLNIEHVSGSAFSDYLNGDSGSNWIWGGGGGNDSINAGDGGDLVEISAGNHVLWGGAGLDFLSFHGYGMGVTGGVAASLALQGTLQTTGQGTMFFDGFEGLVGATYADTLDGDGANNWLAGNAGDDVLRGGAGSDVIGGDQLIECRAPWGGNGGVIVSLPDVSAIGLYAGNDTLDGGVGNDLLFGGAGDDLLIGGIEGDELNGNDGFDTASYAAVSTGIDVNLVTGTAATAINIDTLSSIERVIGTAFHDNIRGADGQETLSGEGGDDFVVAGKGEDLVFGGDGHDYLRGEYGDDVLKGDDGDDLLYGQEGSDILEGGSGWDRAGYSVSATGGVKVDLNLQGTWQDTGQGKDFLTGIEHLSGTIYDDVLVGDDGDNWLWGGSDTTGVTGNDTISGGKGDDLVEVGSGDHVLDGGDDVDTLDFFGNGTDITSAGVVASLAAQGTAQSTGQGTMLFQGFENLSGSIYDDKLTGDDGANLLAGNAGGDELSGGDGDDVLLGDGQVRVDSHLVGSSGPIVIETDRTWLGTYTGGDDTLDGGAGEDRLVGGLGGDLLLGGADNDTFVFTRIEDSLPSGHDLIGDLEADDLIDLSAIDADVTTAGDQAFTLVSRFSSTAGEMTLDYDSTADVTYLSVDVDGDASADMVVEITGKWYFFSNFVF